MCLDAYHMKNRKFPTQLFVATMLDGYMRGVILCYAIAPVENTDNWAWFLRMLLKSIDGIDVLAIPFISDRLKGLTTTMHDIFPDKLHGHCAHHLRGNGPST